MKQYATQNLPVNGTKAQVVTTTDFGANDSSVATRNALVLGTLVPETLTSQCLRRLVLSADHFLRFPHSSS
jgi:hypothetical protein